MGGGHVSRPDFGMPQPDPAHPLTEFYCLLQRALDREGVFALPALYAQFRAPARRIYADEAADFLTLSPDEEAGSTRLLAPAQLQLLYSSLHVMPDGAPAALLLTEECTRTVYAVQLLPPFVSSASLQIRDRCQKPQQRRQSHRCQQQAPSQLSRLFHTLTQWPS